MYDDPFLRKKYEKKENNLYADPFFKKRDYNSNMLGNLGLLPKQPVNYDTLVRTSKGTEEKIDELTRKMNFLIERQDAADSAARRVGGSAPQRDDRKVNFSGDLQSGRLPARTSADTDGHATEAEQTSFQSYNERFDFPNLGRHTGNVR